MISLSCTKLAPLLCKIQIVRRKLYHDHALPTLNCILIKNILEVKDLSYAKFNNLFSIIL